MKNKMKTIASLLIMTSLLSACSSLPKGTNEFLKNNASTIGTVTGVVVGIAVGDKIGNASGKLIGAAIGGILGNYLANQFIKMNELKEELKDKDVQIEIQKQQIKDKNDSTKKVEVLKSATIKFNSKLLNDEKYLSLFEKVGNKIANKDVKDEQIVIINTDLKSFNLLKEKIIKGYESVSSINNLKIIHKKSNANSITYAPELPKN